MLADGETRQKSKGEIHEVFTRDKWSVKFDALVLDDLSCEFYGGMSFQKQNGIDILNTTDEIVIQNKYRIYSTNPHAPTPPQPMNNLIHLRATQVVMPGQGLRITLPPTLHGMKHIAIEPRGENRNSQWPPPQICEVKENKILVMNRTLEPLIAKHDVHVINALHTFEMNMNEDCWHGGLSDGEPDIPNVKNEPKNLFDKIKINKTRLSSADIEKLATTHEQYKSVFNEDLTDGVSGNYTCLLYTSPSPRDS